MLKWLLIIVGVIVGLVLIVTIIGALLPKKHTASRTARFNQPADRVWRIITDHANEPTWRGDIRKKERLPDQGGHAVWREHRGRGDVLTLETIELQPPSGTSPGRMVGRIADENLPFGGTWTFVLTPEGAAACTLTITEDGEIYNPIFRFMARFVIGYHGSIDGYLRALGNKCREEARFD
jgi:uncharacterized protein YndB with AHSA1/START domain